MSTSPFSKSRRILIVVFVQTHSVLPDGREIKHCYAQESVGIATGILITALHHAELVSLTYISSQMGFLNEMLHRPSYEASLPDSGRGLPGRTVPIITKKPLEEIATLV